MTAQERALAALRADILSGELTPGQQLIQEDIADRLGVSRIPLREALQLLASEGLVVHVAHRGYFVTELSVTDLQEVYRLREILEAEAIAAALPGLSDEDVVHLRELAVQVHAAQALGDLTAANRRFHFAVFDAAGMPRLSRLLRQLWDASDAYRALYFQQGVNRQRVHAEHDALLEAIEARDIPAAVALQAAHRAHSVAWVRAQLLRQAHPLKEIS